MTNKELINTINWALDFLQLDTLTAKEERAILDAYWDEFVTIEDENIIELETYFND